MATKTAKNTSDKKNAKDIEFLQSQYRQLMNSELKALQGETGDRKNSLSRLHNAFLRAIQNDAVNVLNKKSPNQSTYDYIASALTGRTIDPNNPNDVASARKQLDQLLSGGDAQITSYFMASGLSEAHIYDEIDSICAYMYQLDEAIDVIRDCVFSSDNPAEGISMDIKFEGLADADATEYKKIIVDMFRDEGLTKKITSHVGKKGIMYGRYYTMTIPHSDITEKLANIRGGYGALENTLLFESASSNTTDEYTLESVMRDVAEIIEYNPDDKSGDKQKKALYETICNNVKQMSVCENSDPPNVIGMDYNKLAGMDKEILDAVLGGNKRNKSSSGTRKGTKEWSDGLINQKEIQKASEGMKGCYIELVDPRQMVPIKIFDYTIGYYYAENCDFSYGGTTITDMLSNTMNFDNKTQVVDRIVDSVIDKLKYKDVLAGNSQFRNLILNCLMYTENRNNPIRIKFVPVDYVTEWNTNTDAKGNGQPVLLRSLVFSRLYISLLLFYITAIITKSTDSEYYYLKESTIDPQYENQVASIMDQLQQCNLDPIAIAQGQMLNASRAVNKRYFMSTGVSGEKMFDIDVMSGQNISIDNELLTDIKKQAISSTGVPSVMIDMVDEIEYATMVNMANIKNLRRCNIIQIDYNPSITDFGKKVAKLTTSIPHNVIDGMSITLRPSKIIQNNLTAQQMNDNAQVALSMIKSIYRGDDSGDISEYQKRVIDKAARDLTIELSTSCPWEAAKEILENAKILAKQEMEEDEALKANEQSSE